MESWGCPIATWMRCRVSHLVRPNTLSRWNTLEDLECLTMEVHPKTWRCTVLIRSECILQWVWICPFFHHPDLLAYVVSRMLLVEASMKLCLNKNAGKLKKKELVRSWWGITIAMYLDDMGSGFGMQCYNFRPCIIVHYG